MRYLLIDNLSSCEYATAAEAIKAGNMVWNALTSSDKKRRSQFYVLKSVNPDENACDHFDGDIIKDYMEESK